MATFCYFPTCFLVPGKLSLTRHRQLRHPTRDSQHFHIRASATKKPRRSGKIKSDAELCNDIQEFIRAVGLPEDHIPSTKELLQHGRNDLASIVRRRGYKVIRELLTSSLNANSDTFNDRLDTADDCESVKADSIVGDVTASTKISGGKNSLLEENDLSELKDHAEDVNIKEFEKNTAGKMVGEITLSSTVPSIEEHSHTAFNDSNIETEDKEFKPFKSSIDNFSGISNGYDYVSKAHTESESVEEVQLGACSAEKSKHQPRDNTDLSGNSLTSKQVVLSAALDRLPRDDHMPAEDPTSRFSKDLDAEDTRRQNQSEINSLKIMLYRKELELSQLKEKVEKEKLALSILQTKETEINKAQKLIFEKDAELHEVEEKLSGLKEIQIDFYGDGNIVEVAGSFNGWHHQIRMDPQPSALVTDPTGSRGSRNWSTVLLLYPGVYEIKFIVDGHWRLDPQRESVTRGDICNNILTVDR